MIAKCRTSKVRAAVVHDLVYLKEESKLPLAMRNMRQVQTIWKRIHSDLKRHAILQDFENEPMKSRILEFLKGGAVEIRAAAPRARV